VLNPTSVDGAAALRSALVMLAAFVAIGVPSALLLGHAFFERWGVLVGPAAWVIGALLAARAVGLGTREAFLGSLAAIIPNVAAGLLGLHWAGVAAGVGLFALVLGRFAVSGGR